MNALSQQQTVLLGSQPGDAADRNDGAVVFALALLAFGSLMAVAGVYLLFGTGWALIVGSVPVVAIAAAMLRCFEG